MSLKKQLLTVMTFVKISTKRFFRDKTAIFFSIAFPLIFLFVIGGIFGKTSSVNFKVAILNQSQTQFAEDFIKQAQGAKVLKVAFDITSQDAANEKMGRGELDATIILPPDFGKIQPGKNYPAGEATVIYTQNNADAARTLASVLEGEFKAINAKFVQTETPFSVKAVQSNERSLSTFDYIFAGLVGFAILGAGIFGPINVFPELKKQGILRRLHTTPIRVWQYFLATAMSQVIIGMLTMVCMFSAALLVFDLKVVGNYFELALFIALGMVTLLGIGLAMGGWAKNERQVAPLANIVVFPMMFLSGTFFPRYLMPQWLQDASSLLPLTPMVDGVRLIATEGKHIIDILPQVGLIGLWAVVVYLIAFRVFRWE